MKPFFRNKIPLPKPITSSGINTKGYIDIALLKRSGVEPSYEALFEIKYLKKGEYNEPKKSEELLHEKIEQARRQLT